MLPKSLKTNIYIFFCAIFIQMCSVMADVYYQYQGTRLETTRLAILEVKTEFFKTIALEATHDPLSESNPSVAGNYQPVIDLIANGHLALDTALLGERERLFGERAAIKGEQNDIYANINGLLPTLSTSVQYIHEHHIAYLKNLLRRGKEFQDYDTGTSFERSPIHSAPELDIIQAAISIQNSMLETFEVFSRLQRGYSPNAVIVDFKHTIDAFYAAINSFEDFSLDAQDGLLVEELLLNGRTFEVSFKRFITLEQQLLELSDKLNKNRNAFIKNSQDVGHEIQHTHQEFIWRIKIMRYVSLLVSVLMLGALFVIGKQLFNAIRRTVTETKRLQDDLAYRIPDQKHDIHEFSFIFDALNSMANTISHQVKELEASQTQLEARVRLRTRELSAANQKLLAEIKDRIRNEQERRALEDELGRSQKMEALGTLAGGVAHDLNNILSGVVSYPDLILMDLPEDHALRRPLMTIKSSGEKAAAIVQDLLTLARRGVSKQEPVNLNTVINTFLESPEYQTIISVHQGVDVDCRLSSDIGVIKGSSIHLAKTVMNLVSNAAEAITNRGTITISTSQCYVDDGFQGYDNIREGEYIKLTVADTGMGIADEDLKRIFEPFFTTKAMGRSGSGLGMAVVWGTVKDHGGFIDIHSRPSAGTTFDLYFPMCSDMSILAIDEDMAIDAGKGETVLVVDDVQEQREIASMMLERLGYRVVTVDSGEKAVAYLNNNPVDILLLDMIMPTGIDGLETYRQIIKCHPDQKAVIASGYSENEKITAAQRLGAGPYIKKPYKMIELAAMIRYELDKGRADSRRP